MDRYLDYKSVKYLFETNNGEEQLKRQNIAAINKNKLDNLDKKNPDKKFMCIGLAKRYIQFANLFAAIVGAINPTYTYHDTDTGNEANADLENIDNIPPNSIKNVTTNSLCSKRLDALLKGNGNDVKTIKHTLETGNININPDFCNINCKDGDCSNKNLLDATGMPELETLYYDKYNYKTGQFDEMSENMKKVYKKM